METTLSIEKPIPEDALREFHEYRRDAYGRYLYYSEEVSRYTKYNNWIENSLIIFSSGTIASLSARNTFGIEKFDLVLCAISSAITLILSLIKRINKYPDKIKSSKSLFDAYHGLTYDFNDLEWNIQRKPGYSYDEYREKFGEAMVKIKEFTKNENERKVKKLIKVRFENEINEKLSVEKWRLSYLPPEQRYTRM